MLTVLRRLFRRIDAVVLCCALGLSAFSVTGSSVQLFT